MYLMITQCQIFAFVEVFAYLPQSQFPRLSFSFFLMIKFSGMGTCDKETTTYSLCLAVLRGASYPHCKAFVASF